MTAAALPGRRFGTTETPLRIRRYASTGDIEVTIGVEEGGREHVRLRRLVELEFSDGEIETVSKRNTLDDGGVVLHEGQDEAHFKAAQGR